MNNSVFFHTLGCRLNQAETASLENSFESRGYAVVDSHSDADIVVINTCTVTQHGDSDTRRLVGKIVRHNPHARIALVGCQAQVQKEKLAKLPNVRWIVGNQRKMDLADVFNEYPNPNQAQVIAPAIERKPFALPVAAVDRSHIRANIKIQDGCDFFCSFCEIPYARGRARSRIFDDIILEARALAAAGHKEIVLTGINIGTYQNEGKGLLEVILALEKIDDIKRIRISSIEPTTIPMAIVDLMGPGHKLCRYLHIPLQSGHDDILTAMKRKYSVKEFSEFVRMIRAKVPGICIGTDVIVGFPGETDEHFAMTEGLVQELPIDYFHIFSYSPRHMAKSSALDHGVGSFKISQRSQILRDLSQRKRRLYYESLLGSVGSVIFEELKGDFWVGFTDNYVRIRLRSQENLSGQMRTVRLISVEEQYAEAEMYGL
jgi:threonylcarbamoyladenosine tRNA methylthiotransferase MtaB